MHKLSDFKVLWNATYAAHDKEFYWSEYDALTGVDLEFIQFVYAIAPSIIKLIESKSPEDLSL